MAEGLGLAELVRNLRAEVAESRRDRAAPGEGGPWFEITEVALEAHVVITQRDQAHGGFDVKILAVGGESEVQHERVHKIVLTLKPQPRFNPARVLIQNMVPDKLKPSTPNE